MTAVASGTDTGVRSREALEGWRGTTSTSRVERSACEAPRQHRPTADWLSGELAECLARRAKSRGAHGLVFGTTRVGINPREVGNLLRAIRRVLAEAGLSWAVSRTLRRTVATWMDASGAPLAEIANQLGHAHVTTTAGYLGRRQASTRAATVMTLGSSDPLAGWVVNEW